MISLEIVIPGAHSNLTFKELSIASCIEVGGLSDREPSLWNDMIARQPEWTIVHIFDRSMAEDSAHRWLYDDLNHDIWPRLKLADEIGNDLKTMLEMSIAASVDGSILLVSDYQFGPVRYIYKPMSLKSFWSIYTRYGFRNNSAAKLEL